MQFFGQHFTSAIKRSLFGCLAGGALLLLACEPAVPQVSRERTVVNELFSGSTVYGWTVGGQGARCLTARGNSPPGSIPNCGTPADPPGQGALRLTNSEKSSQTFAFYNYAIPSGQGLVITFDYFAYGGQNPNSAADGTTFFLFDGSTSNPAAGATGGSLGYAQKLVTTPSDASQENGLTNAYIGVGLDEFGNFANDYEGRGSGNLCLQSQSPNGVGTITAPSGSQIKDSITIRGPGTGLNGYCFLQNSGSLSGSLGPTFSLDNAPATSRTTPNTVRRVRVTLGTDKTISLDIDFTGTGTAYRRIINAFPAPPNPPNSFKFGFASSTGAGVNVHEVVNLRVDTIDIPPRPDLAITKIPTGNFFVGGTGSYTLRVQNQGDGPTYGPVTITDTLPAGFTFTGATGTNWNCSANGQVVTCVYNGPAVTPGSSVPDLTLNVNVGATPGNFTNTAQVFTQADSNPNNDTAQVQTAVTTPQPNLRLVKRITSVTRGGVLLGGVDLTTFIDDPNDPNDNAPGWAQLSPVGAFRLGIDTPLQSNDEVEYTTYFLSDGNSPVNNIRFCDLIPSGTTFVPNSILATIATVPVGGNFLTPLAPLPAGNSCSNQTNPDGAVIVNLGNISNAAGNNFGFVRFRVRIK